MFHWVNIDDIFNNERYFEHLVVSENDYLFLPMKNLTGSIIKLEPCDAVCACTNLVHEEFAGVVNLLESELVINYERLSDAFIVLMNGKAVRIHDLRPHVSEDADIEMTYYKNDNGIVVHKLRVPYDLEPNIQHICKLLSAYTIDFENVDIHFCASISDLATNVYTVHMSAVLRFV